ncbi:MAG: sensor domain-containing diguanylate cyclase [Rhodospirillales bacterium]|nr:sensor domain-containing diguanylate cyclase [Rhodospirillales bacterium]
MKKVLKQGDGETKDNTGNYTQELSFEELVGHDEKLKVFNDTVPAGILVLRVDDGKVVFSNRFFFEALGADGNQVLGDSWDDFFFDPEERQKMMMTFAIEGVVRNFEIRLKKTDGEIIWGLASMAEIPIQGEDLLLFAFIDITPLKEAEAEIRNLANHDPLTGLPSRRLFDDRLGEAMARARREETEMAILFIDLDGFKAVNDTLGHEAGDQVLVEVSERLHSCVREIDTVARIGGDEFIVIIERQDISRAMVVGDRVVKRLSQPIETPAGVANIGASVGIAVYPKDGNTAVALIKSADKAMYAVKKTTKGAVTLAS